MVKTTDTPSLGDEGTRRDNKRLQALRAGVRQGRGVLGRNWHFCLLLAGATILRVIVTVAFQPVITLELDAHMYIVRSITNTPEESFHPFLYPLLLRPLLATGDLMAVAVAQHAAGLTMGTLLYLLLRRLGVGSVLAAVGVIPVFFNGFQLNIEHQILSETFLQLFVVGALVTLAWRDQPRTLTVGIAGALIALSALVRFPGLAVIVAAVAYVSIRRLGWIKLMSLMIGFLVPLGVYALWFRSQSGTMGITNRNGFFLYGRVVEFADCAEVEVPRDLQVFCPPKGWRPPKMAGLFTSGLPDRVRRDPVNNAKALEFSKRMIYAKPVSYAAAVFSDFLMYFRPGEPETQEPSVGKWTFKVPRAAELREKRRNFRELVPRGSGIAPPRYRVDRGLATSLAAYQEVVWGYGVLLAALLILGLVGGVVGWGPGRERPLGPACWLFTLAALGLLLFPPVFAVYHFRYVLPAIPLMGPAAVLGVTAIIDRHSRSTRRIT